ncbi:MAG: putative baseplate assembly protein [Terriglobales bacterium]
MATQYYCKNEQRRALIRDTRHEDTGKPILNGIDYLEIGSEDQRTLKLHFVHALPGLPGGVPPSPAAKLTEENVVIGGGVRVNNLWVDKVTYDTLDDKTLIVEVNQAGDFSFYRLRLVQSVSDLGPPEKLDPQLSEVMFSFKVECPSEFDCQTVTVCPPTRLPEPALDYLAKDYASFRRLMLDRLSLLLPEWKERRAADGMVALVELLAYVGDQLSYYQDAVATEAYLGTARKRISARRHARLLDYPMHDGCNARAWVVLEVDADADGEDLRGPSKAEEEEERPGTQLLTQVSAPRGRLPKERLPGALAEGALVFETMHDLTLYSAHNKMSFYTWGDTECCLPKGATRATLRRAYPMLKKGQVVLFEEVLSPTKKSAADADPERCHAVRLTEVNPNVVDPLTQEPLTEIEWHAEDALPFPLCISSAKSGAASVARGNVVLADHGRTIQPEEDNQEPKESFKVPAEGPFRPVLEEGPLTQQRQVRERKPNGQPNGKLVPVDPEAPAGAAFRCEMQDVRPAIRLREAGSEDGVWLPQRDLLGSDRFAREFVVEVAEDGQAQLRFGDNVLGRRPEEDLTLAPTYRVGNGRVGNVGRKAIAHVVTGVPGIVSVRNPMPAQGGRDPESLEQVRLYAPQAFRRQQRAVSEADYAEVGQRHPEVQKAAAAMRWTGSWYTAFVTLDRKGGRAVDSEFDAELVAHLERYRMAGVDVEVDGPQFVPLDVALKVCVKPGYLRSNVKQALLEAFSNRDLPRGGRGFFHPDNFTFGQPVYVSQLYEVAGRVEGVAWVKVTRFQRWGRAASQELKTGVLHTGRTEIVQLDNSPNFPENGRMELEMQGGL